MGPPGATRVVPQGDQPDSDFHRAVGDSGVIADPSRWFAAFRLLTNLFYEQLPLLTVSPMQRYYMCFAIAETVDDVLGVSWQDRLGDRRGRPMPPSPPNRRELRDDQPRHTRVPLVPAGQPAAPRAPRRPRPAPRSSPNSPRAETALAAAADSCSEELYDRIGTAVRRRRAPRPHRTAPLHPQRPRPEEGTRHPTPAVTALADRATRNRERLRDGRRRRLPGRRRPRTGRSGRPVGRRRPAALARPAWPPRSTRRPSATGPPSPARARSPPAPASPSAASSSTSPGPWSARARCPASPPSASPNPPPTDVGRTPATSPSRGAAAFPGLDRVMLGYVLGGLPTAPTPPTSPSCGWACRRPPRPTPRPASCSSCELTDAGMRRFAVPLDGPVGDLLDAVSMGPRRFPAVVAHVAERAGVPGPRPRPARAAGRAPGPPVHLQRGRGRRGRLRRPAHPRTDPPERPPGLASGRGDPRGTAPPDGGSRATNAAPR